MKRTLTLFVIALMALGTSPAFAAGQRVENEDREDRADREARVAREDRDGLTGNLYRISEIESLGIVSQADEEVGDVEETVFGLEGQVTHLIVELRDVQGVENGKYLVPLDAMRIYDTENMTLDLQRAQDFQSYEDDSATQRAHQLPEGSVRSSDLRGYDVIGPRDDRIASTEDVVVDLGTGQVVYVAIASGGFLGMGREYYAVSFDQMEVVAAEEQIRLDVTEDDLERLTGFDTDNWPAQGQDTAMVDAEDQEVAEDRDAEDREVAEGRDGLTGNLFRISEIKDFDITGDADEQIGNVDEVVLSLEGQITHLIAHLYELEGLEDGRYLVPLDAVSLHDAETIKIDAQQAQEFAMLDDYYGAWAGDTRMTSSQTATPGRAPLDMGEGTDAFDDSETARAQQLPEGTERSSVLLRYDVVAGTGDDVIASTEDLVVDLETNEVVYVAIGSGGFLGIGRNYYAISFDQLQVEVAEQRFRIDMTEESFAQLEGFDHGNWPSEGGDRRLSAVQHSTDKQE